MGADMRVLASFFLSAFLLSSSAGRPPCPPMSSGFMLDDARSVSWVEMEEDAQAAAVLLNWDQARPPPPRPTLLDST